MRSRLNSEISYQAQQRKNKEHKDIITQELIGVLGDLNISNTLMLVQTPILKLQLDCFYSNLIK